jgi:hypothetical protein
MFHVIACRLERRAILQWPTPEDGQLAATVGVIFKQASVVEGRGWILVQRLRE